MNVEEKAIFMRKKLDGISLNERTPLGSPGLRILNAYYDLANGLDIDITEWEE